MEIKNPIVIHMVSKLEKLEEAPLRAAYMAVEQLYLLQEAKNKDINATNCDSKMTGNRL